MYIRYISLISLFIFLMACSSEKTPTKLFTSLEAETLGIDFVNQLRYSEDMNPYTYRNFYNGGGVGIADLNNDGLVDLYFTGNFEDNKLYLNRGDFQFEDVTEDAGVSCPNVWSTGVSLVDINGDGWMDIYVCKAGKPEGDNRYNELFICKGLKEGTDIPIYEEQAKQYNIADEGFSTHAAFFDYDKDGDLDCYLLNNSFRPIGSFDLRKNQRTKRDSLGGNKFYRNDGDIFTDISEEANIYGSIIGFGLGVTVGDVNRDGWQDIFVSNDFFERDYLYINQKDGTFSEEIEQQINEISAASMGADMADINNDGYPEIFVTDMLPEPDYRLKTKTTFEDWDKYQINLRNGYYHQFTRNVLQLNNGDNTFSEIGRMAGVNATDWSWGALIMDMDNDGLKDIYVANGIYQDLTDQDYINFIADPRTVRRIITRDNVNFKELIDAIPIEQIPNYAFKNKGDLSFENLAQEWGLGTASHSNGAAYGDIDNDGDLDLVVNNVNMPPFIYRNEARQLNNKHFLQFKLIGEGKNSHALGTQITVFHEDKEIFLEQMPMRGFESTMDYRPHMGLGEIERVDSVVVRWPNDSYTILRDVPSDQVLTLEQSQAKYIQWESHSAHSSSPLLTEIETPPIAFNHKENEFIDFNRDRLIYHMLSYEGPHLAKGDVNNDGLEDIFIGGAKDSPGSLFIQKRGGNFVESSNKAFEINKSSEDTDAAFFDADGDGDQDLYVCSGGNEVSQNSTSLLDRLYINDGNGNFTKSPQLLPLPTFFESTSTVNPMDYDQDGDIDLFVGTRLKPFYYGVPCNGYILNNDGNGNFNNVSDQIAPGLKSLGFITDAVWTDIDLDDDKDLIVVGEWMPITVFENADGRFKRVEDSSTLGSSNGFWNKIVSADLDLDGDEDYVLANHGINTRFKASKETPVCMYTNDYDQNGYAEQIICVYNGNNTYPLALRHDLIEQLPSLKKKYLKYANYQEQTIEDIFSPQQLEKAIKREVYLTESIILRNNGGTFSIEKLPVEAQMAPMYGITIKDLNNDQLPEILMAGNFYQSKPEVGIYDASYGVYLEAQQGGSYAAVSPKTSGFFIRGQVRDLLPIKLGTKEMIIAGLNNAPIKMFQIK